MNDIFNIKAIGQIGQIAKHSKFDGLVYTPCYVMLTTLIEAGDTMYKVHTEFAESEWIPTGMLMTAIDDVRQQSLPLLIKHNEHHSGLMIIDAEQ